MPKAVATDAILSTERLIFSNATPVVISATDHQSVRPAALYVGVGGTVIADCFGIGTQITFKGALPGTTLPCFVTKVYKTGTTATDMLFLE